MRSNFLFSSRPYTPKDTFVYSIPLQVIHDTERVLMEYAEIKPSNEGMVYWGGTKCSNRITVQGVIAPQTESDYGSVSISHRSNFDFVGALNKHHLVQIAQVHSHPSKWIDHSTGDDQMAAFKIEGLLSMVVPEYCINGMLPLATCGIHRYIGGNFKRLSKKYVSNHFLIGEDLGSFFEDFRK
jgi:hypothetical protein